jgi:hypothetical protein
MTREYLLDAMDMEPPEPLVRTLELIENLDKGDYVRFRHQRDPFLLYDNLKQRNFSFITCTGSDVAVEVFIWREGDAEAQSVVQDQADKLTVNFSSVKLSDP